MLLIHQSVTLRLRLRYQWWIDPQSPQHSRELAARTAAVPAGVPDSRWETNTHTLAFGHRCRPKACRGRCWRDAVSVCV